MLGSQVAVCRGHQYVLKPADLGRAEGQFQFLALTGTERTDWILDSGRSIGELQLFGYILLDDHVIGRAVAFVFNSDVKDCVVTDQDFGLG